MRPTSESSPPCFAARGQVIPLHQRRDYRHGMPWPPVSSLLLPAPGIPPVSALSSTLFFVPEICFLMVMLLFFFTCRIICIDSHTIFGGGFFLCVNVCVVRCSKPIYFLYLGTASEAVNKPVFGKE
jgi:hypothetical protein